MKKGDLETLENVGESIISCINNGVHDRKSDFHTFTLCTGFKSISGRTVVIRGYDSEKNIIIFHSNYSSEKINEIKDNPKVCCVFYSRKDKIQMRCYGMAELNYQNDQTKTSWAKMGHMSKECYFQNPLPGTKLKDFNSFTTSPLTTESKYFCVVTIKIDKIDWLYLKREGHRRAEIYLNNIAQSHWLSP